MEKIKITKVDVKDSGMFVLGFTDSQGFNPGEATGNKKWQSLECTFLQQSIGCIVSIALKQNGQYCNIDKVDMSTAPTSVLMPTMPITESEKVVSVPISQGKTAPVNANLLSVKDVQIISQCMMKCMYYNKTPTDHDEVYESYQYFVKKLEENG